MEERKNIRASFPKIKCQKNILNIFSFNYLDIQVLVKVYNVYLLMNNLVNNYVLSK